MTGNVIGLLCRILKIARSRRPPPRHPPRAMRLFPMHGRMNGQEKVLPDDFGELLCAFVPFLYRELVC